MSLLEREERGDGAGEEPAVRDQFHDEGLEDGQRQHRHRRHVAAGLHRQQPPLLRFGYRLVQPSLP